MFLENKRAHSDVDENSNDEKRLRPLDDGLREISVSSNQNQPEMLLRAYGNGVEKCREEESSCLDCGYPGVIKFQPTEVPFFRNIVVMPFSCLNCRFESTEIQPEPTQDRGTKCVFRIETIVDLERRVFKSESCVCLFQELEIEIPARRSQVSTIASILRQIIYDLSADQPSRLNFDVETYLKIKSVLDNLGKIIFGDDDCFPLSFIIDDPTGNSFIEYNPGDAPNKWSRSDYIRTN